MKLPNLFARMLKLTTLIAVGLAAFSIPLGVPTFMLAASLHFEMAFGWRLTLAVVSCLWLMLVKPLELYSSQPAVNLVSAVCNGVAELLQCAVCILERMFIPRR